MSDKKGWIKSYRSVLDNPVVTKSTDHMAVWVYLLHTATIKKKKDLFNGKEIILKPGQLITGRDKISEKYKNLTASKVQRVLKDFENAHQIEQQTSPRGRLITLINWNKFQSSEQPFEQQVDNNRTTSEQQPNNNRTLYKNSENIKNGKNERGAMLAPLGRFKNVLLAQNELNELKTKFPNDYEAKIERLSRYLENTGKTYRNHFSTLLEWLEKDVGDKQNTQTASYTIDELEQINTLDDIEVWQ